MNKKTTRPVKMKINCYDVKTIVGNRSAFLALYHGPGMAPHRLSPVGRENPYTYYSTANKRSKRQKYQRAGKTVAPVCFFQRTDLLQFNCRTLHQGVFLVASEMSYAWKPLMGEALRTWCQWAGAIAVCFDSVEVVPLLCAIARGSHPKVPL